jgi:membrane glycosyltransferase
MLSLLGVVAVLLFLPKILGVLLCLLCLLRRGRRLAFGGGWKLLASSAIELAFAVLIAPVMMTFHAYFVACILLGCRVRWDLRGRAGQYVRAGEALRRTILVSLAGVLWGVGTWTIAPIFFWALTPVLAGLVLAAPLISISSSSRFGRRLRTHGLLLCPGETHPPRVLQTADALIRSPVRATGLTEGPTARLPALLPDRPGPMPSQAIDGGPRWDTATSSRISRPWT